MGLLSRFFRKREEPSLDDLDKAVTMGVRLLKLDLFSDLSNIYTPQMDQEAARTLAAQVANFLVGEDIEEIARKSDEPLRSRIMAILPQVRQWAAKYMQADRQTREIIVATHRMATVLNFAKYGEAWLENPEKMRVERLLIEYGPEFPDEITPVAYTQLFASYHAIKRTAWAAK